MLWIPVVQGAHSLYDYLQQVQGYLAAAPHSSCSLRRILKRLNAQRRLYAMVAGFTPSGLFRMLVDTPVTMKLKGFEHGYTRDLPVGHATTSTSKYFRSSSTLLSALVMVLVSSSPADSPAAALRANQEPHLWHPRDG